MGASIKWLVPKHIAIQLKAQVKGLLVLFLLITSLSAFADKYGVSIWVNDSSYPGHQSSPAAACSSPSRNRHQIGVSLQTHVPITSVS